MQVIEALIFIAHSFPNHFQAPPVPCSGQTSLVLQLRDTMAALPAMCRSKHPDSLGQFGCRILLLRAEGIPAYAMAQGIPETTEGFE